MPISGGGTASSGQPSWLGSYGYTNLDEDLAVGSGLGPNAFLSAPGVPPGAVDPDLEWCKKGGRPAYFLDLSAGKWRVSLQDPPIPVDGSVANHDVVEFLIHFRFQDNVAFKIYWGRNGRYGTTHTASAYDIPARVDRNNVWGPILPEYRTTGTASVISTPDEIEFTLSGGEKIFFEAIRLKGNVTWNTSGSQQRTQYTNVKAYGLPVSVEYDASSALIKFDDREAPIDYTYASLKLVELL